MPAHRRPKSPVKRLIQQAIKIKGGPVPLAAAIGMTPNAIQLAMHRQRVSPRMAALIETATEGAVSKADLCPDVFAPQSGA